MGYFIGYPNKSFVENEFAEADARHHYRYTNLPEISRSMKTENGEIVIIRCSHCGVEYCYRSKKDYQQQIEMVYGGFHLLLFDRKKTNEIAALLKNNLAIHKIAPAHCTGYLVFRILSALFGEN